MQFNLKNLSLNFTISNSFFANLRVLFEKRAMWVILLILSGLSIASFLIYLNNGLGVAYNDARSHLDIGRRVVENLKPGFAQLGSVWLPLPHLLMTLTVWNDTMWHTGLSGAIQSMIAYVGTGGLIYLFLRRLGVTMFGRLAGVALFALNLNILYMQSTAMTELLLIGTMVAGMYELMLWHKSEEMFRLIKAAFWIMLSTLIRYDGWFLFLFAVGLILFQTFRKHGYKQAEGVIVLFCTLGGFGIFLWLLWNQIIFKDALYFAFGPYSANHQQKLLEEAGVLATKHDFLFSLKTYMYAMVYNSNFLAVILAAIGAVMLWFDKRIDSGIRIATIALVSPFFFNVVALFLGHSVLFVQGLNGNSWFNVRYGLMMVPSIAIFVGYLIYRAQSLRYVLVGLLALVSVFSFINKDAVTIDDARVGSSGKNVSEVSGWLEQNAKDKAGFVLMSVASHDAIIFSSKLPMKKFIHEGSGQYWTRAVANPEQWARWVVMRTNDNTDNTFKELKDKEAFKRNYRLVHSYPFADIYELKTEFLGIVETEAVITDNK